MIRIKEPHILALLIINKKYDQIEELFANEYKVKWLEECNGIACNEESKIICELNDTIALKLALKYKIIPENPRMMSCIGWRYCDDAPEIKKILKSHEFSLKSRALIFVYQSFRCGKVAPIIILEILKNWLKIDDFHYIPEHTLFLEKWNNFLLKNDYKNFYSTKNALKIEHAEKFIEKYGYYMISLKRILKWEHNSENPLENLSE